MNSMRKQLTVLALVGTLAFISEPLRAADEPFAEDFAKAEVLAEHGDAEGQHQLGKIFDYGWGVPKDSAKASYWYEKAAVQGHVKAQNALGMLLTRTDPERSVRWLRAAAEQGHPSSQHFLGAACEKGAGVPRSYEEAARWYERAARQGDGMAMHGLASLYARGLGVKRNLVTAYAWNNVSATQGWGMSMSYRDVLEKEMTKEQLREAQKLSIQLNAKYGKEPER